MNFLKNETISEVPLTTAPYFMVLDPSCAKVWIALSPATQIARVSIFTGEVEYFEMEMSTLSIAVGKEFVFVYGKNTSNYYTVNKIDRISAEVKHQIPITGGGGTQIVCYEDEFFIVPTTYYSTAVQQYVKSGSTYVANQTGVSASNGQDLALSPNGRHLAYAAGGGNGNGYTIYDYSAHNLNTVFGQWSTGAYPTGASFSGDSKRFASTNRETLFIFDVETHQILAQTDLSYCTYATVLNTAFSLDKKRAFVWQSCSYSYPYSYTTLVNWLDA
jgi:hypothetical protein